MIKILSGWVNVMRKFLNIENTDIEKLSAQRMEICSTCPIRTGNICDPNKFGKHIKTGNFECGCGCNLTAKTRSLKSKCPLGKW